MGIKAIGNISNKNFKQEIKTKEKPTKTPKEIKDGKKKLIAGLAIAGTVAAAGIAIGLRIKSNKPSNMNNLGNAVQEAVEKGKEGLEEASQKAMAKGAENLDKAIQETTTEASKTAMKLQDVKFEEGIASLSNGEKFSGTIIDKLPNGDDIELNCVNGVIQSSKRTGSTNFTKNYYGGIISSTVQELEDGTEVWYKRNGGLDFKVSPDGTTTHYWDKKSVPMYQTLKDGTTMNFSVEGKLMSKNFANGEITYFDDNGEVTMQRLKDGTREYFKNGICTNKSLPDGTYMSFKNGELSSISLPDGTRESYEAGVLESRFFPDGILERYDKDGNVTYKDYLWTK